MSSNDVSVKNGLDLPPASTKRWVKSRKLAVVNAIKNGDLTEEEALNRYKLSEEELQSWFHMIEAYGPDALRTTHLKQYRNEDVRHQTFHMTENSDAHRL